MAQELAIGDRAPAFALPTDSGGGVQLADFRGEQLVIFFYPKDDTPTCTEEAIAFNRRRADFRAAGAELLGVSADSVARHARFKRKHKLDIPLASDEPTEMLKDYGVWGPKTLFGRNYMGIIRSTFLIDAEGRIARVWRNVRLAGHVEEVLGAAQALSRTG